MMQHLKEQMARLRDWLPQPQGAIMTSALDRIEVLETTLRQIADSGDGSINAHLAAQALSRPTEG